MHPLTKWVINKIENEYKDDIALLVGIKGHSTNGDGHGECFDFFVPATERGNELAEIQKYSSGELIYIPESAEKKKAWGEKSGSRDFYIKRNAQIRQQHNEGKIIAELADEFALSTDSIRRILYS